MTFCVLYGLFTNFNVVIIATYAHILPNEKYRKYRVIIVSESKISRNIVWTLKKIWGGPVFKVKHSSS